MQTTFVTVSRPFFLEHCVGEKCGVNGDADRVMLEYCLNRTFMAKTHGGFPVKAADRVSDPGEGNRAKHKSQIT